MSFFFWGVQTEMVNYLCPMQYPNKQTSCPNEKTIPLTNIKCQFLSTPVNYTSSSSANNVYNYA